LKPTVSIVLADVLVDMSVAVDVAKVGTAEPVAYVADSETIVPVSVSRDDNADLSDA